VQGLDPANSLDSLPVRHDRQCFLLALEELLFHPSAQHKAAACLRRLCSDSNPSRLSHTSAWLTDIGYRPSLLLALANPFFGTPDAEKEAAHCLALVARRADSKHIYLFSHLEPHTVLQSRPNSLFFHNPSSSLH
jgi:hypothetical protein